MRALILLSVALSVAALSGCCGVQRPASVTQALKREEIARLGRLPDDGRRMDAGWNSLGIEANMSPGGVTTGRVSLHAPTLRLFIYGGTGGGKNKNQGGGAQMPDIDKALHSLAPIDVNDVDLYDGQILVADMSEVNEPEIWIHDLELSLENVATRQPLSHREPILLTARGKVQRSGELVAFISIDPFAHGLDFAGRVEITHLKSEELYGFLKPKAGLRAPEGEIDLYIAFVAEHGHVRGGVKPVIRNLKLRSAGGAWSCMKAKVGDFFVHLLGRGPEKRLATVVPIEGNLTGPNVEVWPTILGILYDSFVQGIQGGFGGLPPPKATPKQGAATQAARVLVGGERPQAQPAPAEQGKSK